MELQVLRDNERYIYHYKLGIQPNRSDAPSIRLRELLPRLQAMVRDAEAVHLTDKGNVATRLAAITVDPSDKYATLLIQYGDRRSSNPVFIQLQTGALREESKEEGEGGGSSAHLVLELDEIMPGLQAYRLLAENAPSLGRWRLEVFFRHLFRSVFDGETFTIGTQGPYKYWPVPEISGRPSEQLKEGVLAGTLREISLTKHVSKGDRFDENPKVKEEIRRVKIDNED